MCVFYDFCGTELPLPHFKIFSKVGFFFFQTDPLRLFVNIKQDLLFGSSEYIENLAFKLIFTKEDLRV